MLVDRVLLKKTSVLLVKGQLIFNFLTIVLVWGFDENISLFAADKLCWMTSFRGVFQVRWCQIWFLILQRLVVSSRWSSKLKKPPPGNIIRRSFWGRSREIFNIGMAEVSLIPPIYMFFPKYSHQKQVKSQWSRPLCFSV